MKKISFILGLLTIAIVSNAQWAVFDPSNLAQGILNSTKEMVHTSQAATNTLNSFKEAEKIYNENKKYMDALKSIHNLVKDARKVQKTVLMVGEISEIYVENFGKMLIDPNYTTDELEMIAFGYSRILSESAETLEDLKVVITANGLSMTDKERMDLIDRTHNEVMEHRNLMNYFTRKSLSISYIRNKLKCDEEDIKSLYGTDERYW